MKITIQLSQDDDSYFRSIGLPNPRYAQIVAKLEQAAREALSIKNNDYTYLEVINHSYNGKTLVVECKDGDSCYWANQLAYSLVFETPEQFRVRMTKPKEEKCKL